MHKVNIFGRSAPDFRSTAEWTSIYFLKMTVGVNDMKRIQLAAQAVIDDVNSEDSAIIQAFGKGTNLLFKVIVWSGIPFLIWILSQFSELG
jgi:hypothetical protein